VVARGEVLREALVEPVLGTGTISAHKTTDVGPRVSGIVDTIHVAVGDRVEAGDPLFRTRPIDYEIRVRVAESALRLARANAQKASATRVHEVLHGQNVVRRTSRRGRTAYGPHPRSRAGRGCLAQAARTWPTPRCERPTRA
jgi:multidrug efflux pump subunit AcrA (membrane-fusion protein)